jgi:hypothetical protein
MSQKKQALVSLMSAMMANSDSNIFLADPLPRSRAKKEYAPWAGEHIPKKLRKGKSYEEIQEMRKRAYEERAGKT